MLVASDTHALRPAFRELGHVAAFVFEAIEDERAATITTLLQAAGISRNAVSAGVDVLAAHGLVEHSPTGLVAHPERLGPVAELVGALALAAAFDAWSTSTDTPIHDLTRSHLR
jgi:DNA-binding IclR family transcriptional regulator